MIQVSLESAVRKKYASLSQLGEVLHLTPGQVYNYDGMLGMAGVVTPHTHNNRMAYTDEELQILARMSELKGTNGLMHALIQAVGEVLGEPPQKKLIEWYEEKKKAGRSYYKAGGLARAANKVLEGDEAALRRVRSVTHFRLLSDKSPEVQQKARQFLLEDIVGNWISSESYSVFCAYPINLYFSLSGVKLANNKSSWKTEPRPVAARAISAAVQLTPLSPPKDF